MKKKNKTTSVSTKYRSPPVDLRAKCPIQGCRCFDAYPFSYNRREPYKSPVDLRLEKWRAKYYEKKHRKEYREERARALAEKKRKLKPTWVRF